MDSLSDVFGLCRLCLVQEHVNIPIFDDPDNVRQIPLKISSCLPVQVSREDNLPKKICDECSNKLDLCYDFWTSTANAEKTLLSTVEKQNQAPEPAAFQLFKTESEDVAVPEEETQSQIPEPQVPEPILIKAESEEIEAPPAKRPRQSAAIKAQMHMAPESDDDEVTADQDFNGAEDEVEEEIDDPDVPDMSVDIDEVKPGTSGLNLEIADSKCTELNMFYDESRILIKEEPKHQSLGYSCMECYMIFHDINEVERHSHQEGDRFLCMGCAENFALKEGIVNHVKEDVTDDDNMIEECTNLTAEKPCYVLPQESRHKYEATYKRFMNWTLQNNIRTVSDNVILAYMKMLSAELKPSSLWSIFSMLKLTLKLRTNIDISTYKKCLFFLKFHSSGYHSKKSLAFTSEQIKRFLSEAPDEIYLFTKVVLIFGVAGRCRRQELRNLRLSHVRDLRESNELQVKLVDEKTNKTRVFVLSGELYEVTKKYLVRRPANVEDFFLNYKNGRCSRQVVGINKIGYQPKIIAQYLKLPTPNLYTAHCFRISGPL